MTVVNKNSYNPLAAGCLCNLCPLAGSTVVPPAGPPDADFVIVGEAPSFHEERRRIPFVGPSGVLLDDLLYQAGVKRERCWVTNVLLCRTVVPDPEAHSRYDFERYLAWLRKENKTRSRLAKQQKVQAQLIPSPVDCCAPRLRAELGYFEAVAKRRGQPNGIPVLALGNTALKAVTGKVGISKWRGSPLLMEL